MILEKGIFVATRTGSVTEKYKIMREIGRGISGIVYQACERANVKNFRAIKKVQKKSISKQDDLMNELMVLSELDHPDIIRLYETYEDQTSIYYVTDFCEGGQLFDYLEQKCYLSEEEARGIFIQMLGAIKYCHSKKIAHRDLKPENFLLLSKPVEGQPVNLKLIDFGLAIKWQQSLQAQLQKQKRKIVGTAYYISPEIIEGNYDERCDIWSIGVILYILVTGAPPFDGEDDKDILKNISKMKVSFSIPEMDCVSLLLKDLLKKMLKPATERIKIEDIYKHPWMSMKISRAPINVDFKTMANFTKFSKIKTIAATYLASQMTAKETQNLERLFKLLDENHDGCLSLEELDTYLIKNKTSLNAETAKELKNLLAVIDTHSGKINYTQFLASTLNQRVLEAQQNLHKVFNMLDKDGNGMIDRDELLSILSKHGHVQAETEANEIFQTTDVNGDGKIDFSEFKTAICKMNK